MFMKDFFYLFLTPFPFIPKSIHFFVNFSSVIFAHYTSELVKFILGLDACQQSEKIQLRSI